jgi:hypothetical protein
MLKLYKFDSVPAAYLETWRTAEGQRIVHWGELGTRGQACAVEAPTPDEADAVVKERVGVAVAQGYVLVADKDMRVLMIEFPDAVFGPGEDLDKAQRLEAHLNELLGWTGLGMCSGGIEGKDATAICCFVVDFELAKRVIEADLAATEFAGFTRIYDR